MQRPPGSLEYLDADMEVLPKQPPSALQDGDTMDINLLPSSPMLSNALRLEDINASQWEWILGDSTEGPAEDPGTTTACGACLDISDVVITIPCSCRYCLPCLSRYFEIGLANRGSFPPKCCGQAIGFQAVRNHLDPRVLERYEAVEEEFGSRNPTYCASVDCGAFLPGAVVFESFKECHTCLQHTCIKCKNPRRVHGNDSTTQDGSAECPIAELPSEISALMEEEEWSRCPGCQHVVEKIEGCDHMQCVCGEEFCYQCGTAYDDEFCGCSDNLRDEGGGDDDTDLQEEGDEDGDWPHFAAAVDARGRIRCMHELTSPLEEEGDGDVQGGRCHGCLREMPDIRSCDTCHLELCSECLR